MDDLHERLERLADRIGGSASPLEELERIRVRRTGARRVGTVVLALVVALGGTVVAIRAFPDDGLAPRGPGARWQPPDELTIWPESSADLAGPTVEEVQAAVDAGDAGLAWRLDAQEVAKRFADRLFGFDVGQVEPSHSYADADRDRVRAFVMNACPPNARCVSGYFDHQILLVQPARQGDIGIWSVASIQGDVSVGVDWMTPQVSLRAGADLPVTGGFEPGVVAGYHAFDGCETEAGGSASAAGGDTLEIHLPELKDTALMGPDCGALAAGYVWAAIGTEGTDPLRSPGASTSVTIVPLYIQRLRDDFSETASPLPVELTETYVDPFGWSIDYPADWSVLPIEWSTLPIDSLIDPPSEIGAAFSNEPLAPARDEEGSGEPWPDLSQLSRDGVVLIITHLDGEPMPSIADDSSFPLRPGDAAILNAEPPLDRLLVFRGDGLEFWARLGPYGDAPAGLRATLDEMISSLRFQPWIPGDIRNGWLAVGEVPPEGEVLMWEPERGSLLAVVHHPGSLHGVGRIPTCGEGQAVSFAGGYVVIECPDGSVIRYDLDGIGHPDNPPSVPSEVPTPVAFRSWDGMVIVSASPDRGEGS